MNLKNIFTRNYIIFLILEILIVGSVSTLAIDKINNTSASAATPWESCMSINSNARIACIGRSAELTGIRYGKLNSVDWLKYWRNNGYPGLSDMSGSFANTCKGTENVCTWWTKERYNNTTNFLGCNGFVNVALYLALGRTYAGSYSGGYQYLTYTKNGASYKVFEKLQYPKFDDLQPGDLLVVPGHVSIMSRKAPTSTYPRRLYVVQAMGNQYDPSNTELLSNSKTHEYVVRDFNGVKDGLTVLRLQDGLITKRVVPD